MNLTVDASIAVKWSVAESLSDDARRLLSHRLRLHAPDILIVEFANTIWKKARKGEIEDPQPYFDELALLPDAVTLHPADRLIDRAARIAVAIDHPVYVLVSASSWTKASSVRSGVQSVIKSAKRWAARSGLKRLARRLAVAPLAARSA